MAAPALNLFPPRVPFVDEGGLLTRPAVQAFAILVDRVGGVAALPPGSLLIVDANGIARPLPIGTPGQVLTVNPAAPLGVEWA